MRDLKNANLLYEHFLSFSIMACFRVGRYSRGIQYCIQLKFVSFDLFFSAEDLRLGMFFLVVGGLLSVCFIVSMHDDFGCSSYVCYQKPSP